LVSVSTQPTRPPGIEAGLQADAALINRIAPSSQAARRSSQVACPAVYLGVGLTAGDGNRIGWYRRRGRPRIRSAAAPSVPGCRRFSGYQIAAFGRSSRHGKILPLEDLLTSRPPRREQRIKTAAGG
jgi:hypothetical protein